MEEIINENIGKTITQSENLLISRLLAQPPWGAPLELPSLDFAFGEAAPAADLITA